MNNCISILSKGVTPWDEYLELLNCGSSLHDKENFISILENFVTMEEDEFNKKVKMGKECIKKEITNDMILDSYRKIFEK